MSSLFFSLMVLSACTNSSRDRCGSRYLLLWPNGQGQHTFQEIAIPTLESPYELKGPAARVFVESGLAGRGYEGPVARPRLTQSGGVCVPMDMESSMALSAYAQMESLKSFDMKLGIADGLRWPRQVGVEILMRSADGGTHNNAHYFPKDDAIAIIPYSYDGLPMSLNHGVMAHEHFHAHFQARVVNPLNAALDSTSAERADEFERIDLRTHAGLNNFTLRGWNEGLADFYAYVFTDQSNFFSDSRPEMLDVRDLAGATLPFMTAYTFRQHVERIPPAQSLSVASISYQQGTLLARLLFQLSELGPESKELVLQRVIRNLPRLAEVLIQNYERRTFDFEAILPILLRDAPMNEYSCGILRSVLTKNIMSRSFATCSGL